MLSQKTTNRLVLVGTFARRGGTREKGLIKTNLYPLGLFSHVSDIGSHAGIH